MPKESQLKKKIKKKNARVCGPDPFSFLVLVMAKNNSPIVAFAHIGPRRYWYKDAGERAILFAF